MKRTTQGQFAPGSSGNPQGRPKSETAKLRQSLSDGADAVVNAILSAAKAGDMQAAKLVLDRILPPLKATALPVMIELPNGFTPLTAANAILAAAASGKLPPDIAAALVTATGTLARVAEIEEIAARLEALEKALKPRTKPVK